jgi:uncharacterized protein (DUF697 family)
MAKEPSASATHDDGDKGALKTSDTKSDATTPESRHADATKMVERFAMWSGAAGLIPVPFVDLVAIGGLQLQMLRRLSQIYQVPFAENRGKSLITALLGAAIPTSSGLGAAELLKAIPLLGTAIAAFVTPALAAASTFAVGKVFMQHFETGGTLLDFNPPDYREFLKGQKEMWVKRSSSSTSTT